MIEEPTREVRESELDLPTVTTGKKLPSFTDEEIWDFAGDRGVFSDKPEYFKFCFDTLVHRKGVLLYRMKPKEEWFITVKSKDDTRIFSGVMFHDSMEHFCTRETDDGDLLHIMNTHDSDGEAYDYLENWCSVPYESFRKYLDSYTSFGNFKKVVEKYLNGEPEQKKLK